MRNGPATPDFGDDILATSAAGPSAVRGGVLRVVGFGAGALLSIVSASLLFRQLGVEDAGRYATVIALVTIFGGVTEAGLWSVAVRELSARPERETDWDVMRHVASLRILLSGGAALGAVLFALLAGYDGTMLAGTVVYSVAMVLQGLQVAWTAPLAAQLRYGWMTGLDMLRQIMSVGGIIVLALTDASLLAFFSLTVPVAVLTLVPTALVVRRRIPLRLGYSGSEWKRLFKDVLPFAAATAAAAVYFRVTLILMELVSSDTQTGFYSASFRVIEVIIVVPGLIVGAAFPIFARAAGDDPERFLFGVQRVLDTMVIVGCAVTLGIFVGAPTVILILAGSAFAPAAEVLQIQSIGLLGTFVSAVFGFVLLSLRRYRLLLVLSFGPLAANVVLALILASSHGAVGAATATAIVELGVAVAIIVVARRILQPGRLEVLSTIRAVALAVPPGALTLVEGIGAAPRAMAAVALYLGLLWAARGYPAGLVSDLRSR